MHAYYAFAMDHDHRHIYKESRWLMTEGKVTKNKDEILAQLEGIWLSFKAFV